MAKAKRPKFIELSVFRYGSDSLLPAIVRTKHIEAVTDNGVQTFTGKPLPWCNITLYSGAAFTVNANYDSLIRLVSPKLRGCKT